MIPKAYSVGVYVRLSKDDERDGDSTSIENQKHLLTRYVEEQPGWTLHEVYADDGWSGTNFQRPSFQRMLADAKDGAINLILVKDLSRFGRNYIEVGQFTDYVFPSIGCRFVALNDNVDTIHSDNDIMAYKNLFNEFHSRDTSKKVRTIRKAGAERGKFMGSQAPYGYRKDPADKHHLILDGDSGPVIRRIFELRKQGMGLRAIAILLNEEGIPHPGSNRAGANRNGLWSNCTVMRILRNEVYIGHMVQGKQSTLSFKNKKLVGKPEEEWIRVENTHEPLVDRDTWDAVQALSHRNYKPKQAKNGEDNLFAGLLYCADCGFAMRRQSRRNKKRDGSEWMSWQYLCGSYSRSGKHACTAHVIQQEVLEEMVLEDIRKNAAMVVLDEQWVAREIIRRNQAETESSLAFHKQEHKHLTARLAELERLIQSLYEDRVAGAVPETVFRTLMERYEAERLEKEAAAGLLREKIDGGERDQSGVTAWTELMKGYDGLESLSRETLHQLIDRIEIREATGTGWLRRCNVNIIYRFVQQVDLSPADMEAEYGRAV